MSSTGVTVFQLGTDDAVNVRGIETTNQSAVKTISKTTTLTTKHTHLDTLATAPSVWTKARMGGFFVDQPILIAFVVCFTIAVASAIFCGVVFSEQTIATTSSTTMPNLCALKPCGNNSTCSATNSMPYYQCNCINGYSGINCTMNICTTNNPCGAYGNCSFTPSSAPYYTCTCFGGFTGTNCSINPCTTANCSNFNSCTATPTVAPYYVCSCSAGSSNSSTGSCLSSPCGNFGSTTSAGISSWNMTNPCSASTNTGYFLVSFTHYAQSSNETLTIASVNVPAYIYIDDISVFDVTTGTELLCNGGFENGTCICWSGTCQISTSPCRTGQYCINNGLTYMTSFWQTFQTTIGDQLLVSLYTYWTGSGTGVTLDVIIQP